MIHNHKVEVDGKEILTGPENESPKGGHFHFVYIGGEKFLETSSVVCGKNQNHQHTFQGKHTGDARPL